ncbi:hypothetical protein ACFS5J_08535 [Flavobacterium chuncheonense]|uniref:Signal peptidase n=1 Tax=Flavobacterium chuncheonense TaxID=2026653 RepID=A0ABW5YM07_9FLAO
MKSRLLQIVLLVLPFLNPSFGFAADTPPEPVPFAAPPPVGIPIDGGLLGLFLVAVVFGGFVVMKNIRDKKRSTI